MTYDGTAIYDRGAVIVNTLMSYMGRENFLAGIRHYLETYAYNAASSEQLRDALTEATGIDMNGFFDTYVFHGGMPHYAVNLLEVTPNGTLYDAHVQMEYWHIGPSHVGQNNRVEVTFVGANGQMVTAMACWDGLEGEQTFTLDFEPMDVFADYHNRFLDAKTDKNAMVTETGTITLNTYCDFVVNSISDSTLLRIENHLVGPEDPDIPGITLSTRRYWKFFRNDFGEADIAGRFQFTQSSNQDNDIIQSESDSAVLLYRANVMDPWHTIPYTQEGNWKRGRFTVDNVQSGEYVIAAIDKFQIGVNETSSPSLHVYPNPSTGMITVETSSESPSQPYRITNLTGQTLMTGNTQGQIDVSYLPSGSYFLTINGKTQKIVIQ
jgi:aminopeptidase N